MSVVERQDMTELHPVTYGQSSVPDDLQHSLSSKAEFEVVVACAKTAIEDAGFWVLHEINPQALLAKGGYAINPTRQLLFFHPDYMVRVLSAVPAALLEAPLKFAIMGRGDEVVLRWLDPERAFGRYEDPHLAQLGKELAAKCEAIAAEILHRASKLIG